MQPKSRLLRFATLVLFVLMAVPSFAASSARILTVNEAHELLQKPPAQLVILDVRTDKEFAADHIAHAKNIDFFGTTFEQSLRTLDKDKPYLVYCRTDSRSGSAVEMMQHEGFKDVILMKGGITEWKRAKLPLTQ